MKKILLLLSIITGLFSDCKQDVFIASDSAKNAGEYAVEGNHKYALIETEMAIMYTEQALSSCNLEEVGSEKMEELSKNLSSLLQTKKKIVKIITPEKAEKIVRGVRGEPYQPDVQQMGGSKKMVISFDYYKKDGAVYFRGTTNLPENTQIGITFDGDLMPYKIYTKEDGSFESQRIGVLRGKYKIGILIYNNQFWQTKDVLKKLKKYYGYGSKKEGCATVTKTYSF